mmetsp:Transcript_96490/g.251535  ORF Transcript_96490/g.251535 Transcript_96490/m.251535 type:complete len:389 (-) Transcript_96490:397-1563(-)
MHLCELLSLAVNLFLVVLLHVTDLELDHPGGQDAQQQVLVDLLIGAARHAEGFALGVRQHLLEPNVGRLHLLLQLSCLLLLVRHDQPCLPHLGHQTGISGSAHLVEQLLCLVLLAFEVLIQGGLRLLHGFLVLLIPAVLLVEGDPRAHGQDHDGLITVAGHSSEHLHLARLGFGVEARHLRLQRLELRLGVAVPLDALHDVVPRADAEVHQPAVGLAHLAHHHIAHSRELLLLVFVEQGLRLLELLLVLLPHRSRLLVGEALALPASEGALDKGGVVPRGEAQKRLLALGLGVRGVLLQLHLGRDKTLPGLLRVQRRLRQRVHALLRRFRPRRATPLKLRHLLARLHHRLLQHQLQHLVVVRLLHDLCEVCAGVQGAPDIERTVQHKE